MKISTLFSPAKLAGIGVIGAFVGVLALFFALTPVGAQSDNVVTGVVVEVATTSNGDLMSFTLSNNEGEQRAFSVNSATEFGLEDESGERWVATFADAGVPRQAALRLIDHRERFAPITVTFSGDNATQVVEATTSNLGTNLGYIFAAFLVGWLAFFVYLIWLSIRQQGLKNQLKAAQRKIKMGSETDEKDER